MRAAAAALGAIALIACARSRAPRPMPPFAIASPYIPAPVIDPGALPDPPPPPPPEPLPLPEPEPRKFATLRLFGVQMGLGKPDGTAWDFDLGTAATKDDLVAVATALDKEATSDEKLKRVLEVFARPTARVVSKPDIQGSAALVVDGVVTQTLQLPRVSNTFSPTWQKLEWRGVAVDATTRLRVMLAEHDWKAAEPVTPFEITHRDVAAALEKGGKSHPVVVADQTDREVLFAHVSASPE